MIYRRYLSHIKYTCGISIRATDNKGYILFEEYYYNVLKTLDRILYYVNTRSKI